nr:hypothetical protein [Salinispora oceanensis]
MPVTAEQLPVGKIGAAFSYSINHNRPKDAVPEKDPGHPLSAETRGRAVGRARVYYTSYPSIDVLEAVLTGLRRL